MRVGALLLAAGRSVRFGAADKLLAPLNGRPLISAALALLDRPDIAYRTAVVSYDAVEEIAARAGFDIVRLATGLPQSRSLAAGLAHLVQFDVSHALIILGDMPFVSPDDLDRLLHTPSDQPACAALGDTPMPPAVFPRSWFDRLGQLDGDRGAGTLLRTLPVACRMQLPPERLHDVDVPGDLCHIDRRCLNASGV